MAKTLQKKVVNSPLGALQTNLEQENLEESMKKVSHHKSWRGMIAFYLTIRPLGSRRC
jgi:hypothetical protein